MRILLLHSDFIEYQPISKEIESAEEIPSTSSKKINDVIVALIAVEKDDDESIIDDVCKELKTYSETIKCDNILVYPYAHLSSDLANPITAQALLVSVEKKAKSLFGIVNRAPFGWTKSFNVKIKGHPLAEHAKTIQKNTDGAKNKMGGADTESIALKSEDTLNSTWFVLATEGNMIPIGEYSFDKKSAFSKLADYELSKKRTVSEIPPHVKLMKRLALVDYEPSSDGGNMRYYPKGRLMKSLIETRREALEDIRIAGEYLDENFVAHKEDHDLSWRLRLAGWQCWYVPQAIAYHGRTTRGLGSRPYRSAVRDFHRHDESKSAHVRFHAMKNQWLLLLKNEDAYNFARDFPFILARESMILAHNLIFSPRALAAVPATMKLIPETLRKRRTAKARQQMEPRAFRTWVAGESERRR